MATCFGIYDPLISLISRQKWPYQSHRQTDLYHQASQTSYEVLKVMIFFISFVSFPGCTWTFSTAELRGIAQLFFSTNTEYYVHHCYSAVLDSAVLNIYKCWNKKNPVKVLNIMYTIVIQHCWIVKNSAQLQKFSAVLNFMYTLALVTLFPLQKVCDWAGGDSSSSWHSREQCWSGFLELRCDDRRWAGDGVPGESSGQLSPDQSPDRTPGIRGRRPRGDGI